MVFPFDFWINWREKMPGKKGFYQHSSLTTQIYRVKISFKKTHPHSNISWFAWLDVWVWFCHIRCQHNQTITQQPMVKLWSRQGGDEWAIVGATAERNTSPSCINTERESHKHKTHTLMIYTGEWCMQPATTKAPLLVAPSSGCYFH